MHGNGSFTWDDEKVYNGEYFENKKYGYGSFSWPDGKEYKGNWLKGKIYGLGNFTIPGQEPIEGNWQNGKTLDSSENLIDENILDNIDENIQVLSLPIQATNIMIRKWSEGYV